MKNVPALLFLLLVYTITGAQCPDGLAANGLELVTNGDFEAGNTSFTSDYDYCNTSDCLVPEGTYTVAADPTVYHPAFVGSDHTSGSGNFMIVNGSTTGSENIWCQTIGIEPNSYYIVSFWVSSMVAQNNATIQLQLNGFNFYEPFYAPLNTNEWVQYKKTIQSGLLENPEVCLLNLNQNANGNDFGIDDISIKKCECDLGINAGTDQSMCLGDSVQLDGSGSIAYFWSPSTGLSCFICEDPKASPPATTQYYVSVNGPGGCSAIDSVLVTVYQPFDMVEMTDTAVCRGESVQLDANGAEIYLWSPIEFLSNPNVSDPIATPEHSTVYYVSAEDIHGCAQRDSVEVNVFPVTPNVEITPSDTTVCPGKNVQLVVVNGDQFSWSPSTYLSCTDCDKPFVQDPLESVTYVVVAVDSNGCAAGSDTASVVVSDQCIFLVIPSAFSPNNDGRNDLFHALSQGVSDFDLKVFNRWGEMIFSSADVNTGWDGLWNGKAQPVGVYIYTLQATLDDGTLIDKKGNVTLIR
jgi:gliding motility-associated-like protein